MNNKEFLSSLNEIEAKFIEEAADYKAKNNRKTLVRWISIAACICLVATAIGYAFLGKPKIIQGDYYYSKDTTIIYDYAKETCDKSLMPLTVDDMLYNDTWGHWGNVDLAIKFKVAGGAFQHYYKIMHPEVTDYVRKTCIDLLVPVEITEVIKNATDKKLKVGDIVYYWLPYIYYDENVANHYKGDYKEGDIIVQETRNFIPLEMGIEYAYFAGWSRFDTETGDVGTYKYNGKELPVLIRNYDGLFPLNGEIPHYEEFPEERQKLCDEVVERFGNKEVLS